MRVDQSREMSCPAGIRVTHKTIWGKFALKQHDEVEVAYILWGGYDKVGFEARVRTTIYLQSDFESFTIIEHKGSVYHA